MSVLTKYQYGEPIGQFQGRNIFGGDCAGGMPAVFVEVQRSTGGRHPETEEEWELFGAHLPDPVTMLNDEMIHCEDYRALVKGGLAVEACVTCPLNKSKVS